MTSVSKIVLSSLPIASDGASTASAHIVSLPELAWARLLPLPIGARLSPLPVRARLLPLPVGARPLPLLMDSAVMLPTPIVDANDAIVPWRSLEDEISKLDCTGVV